MFSQFLFFYFLFKGMMESRSDILGTSKNNKRRSMFICKNGQVIQMSKKCDKRFDCIDSSDETDCWKHYQCK